MYITLALTAAYTASSYYYNHYNRAQANEYRHKAGVSFAVMSGRLLGIIEGITSGMYDLLLSKDINTETLYDQLIELGEEEKLRNYSYIGKDFSVQFENLMNFIKEFGVHNMQASVSAVLEGEDLEELPYLYMPYHQYIKPSIAMIGVSEFIYQQFDRIKLIYDYQTGNLDMMDIIEEYGIESVPTLKMIGVNFSEVIDFYIYTIVMENGIESIKILKDAGADFDKMRGDYITLIAKKYGKDAIYWLKDAGSDFAKLYGHDIVDIAKKYGKDALQWLKDAGSDFNMLGPYDIGQIIINHGLEIIPFLVNDLDVKLSKMGGGDIAKVTIKYGKDSLYILKNADADFSKMEGKDIVSVANIYGGDCLKLFKEWGADYSKFFAKNIVDFVIHHGLESISFLAAIGGVDFSKMTGGDIVAVAKKYGNESLWLLKDAGSDFDMLGPDDLSHLILDQGLDVVEFLSDISIDFAKMGEKDVMLLLDKYGKNGIDTLHKVGADFSALSLSDVLSVIDTYGEEVIWSFQDAEVDFTKLSEEINDNIVSESEILEEEMFKAFSSIDINNIHSALGAIRSDLDVIEAGQIV